ncbi:MAG: RNA 2',3'-cyclic phosphodiesterase [Stackebrandtia sp.]
MRLFAALNPSEAAADDLREAVGDLRLAHGRAADSAGWHVTLAFLGEVDVAEGPRVREALEAAAKRARRLRLRLAGAGRFGARGGSVLYIGLGGDVDALAGLAAGVRDELRDRKLPFDEKRFRPHLTLARSGGRMSDAEAAADLHSLRHYTSPEWTVDEIVLYRSRPRPKPVYEELAVFTLPE